MLCPQRFILYFEIFGRYWEKNVMTFSFWPVVVVHICSDLISDKKGTGTKKRTGKWPRDLCYKWLLLWRHSTRSHSTRNLFSIAPNVVNLNQATQKIDAWDWCWIKEARNRYLKSEGWGFKSRSSGRPLPQKLCLILLGTLFSAHVLKIMLI